MMRVLQVTTTAHRRGAEVFACHLGEQLRAKGHDVTTVSLNARGSDESLPFEHLGHGRGDPRAFSGLVRRARRSDVVVAHGGSTLAPVALSSRIARRAFVYRNIGDPGYWGRVRGSGLRIGLPLRSANAVVALYDGAARYMIGRYRLDPRRVSVASNAVDVTRFPARDHTKRREARVALGITDEHTVVGYLGSLSSEKRPWWVLDAISAIDDVVGLIAGEGPLQAELASRAARLPDRHGVAACQLVGVVSDPARFLSAIDLLLLPSATEGIPAVLIEAALVGVPTVATDVGGISDVLSATGGGRCVAASDPDGFVEAVRMIATAPQQYRPDRSVAVSAHGMGQVANIWESVLCDAAGLGDQPHGTPS